MTDSDEDSFEDMIVGAAPPAESDSDSGEASRPLLQLTRDRGRELREWMSHDEWRINIEEASDVALLRSPSDVSIFRVPTFLKYATKGGSFLPQIVSLGPYHHRNAELSPMEKHKGRALVRMMMRFNLNHDKDPTAKEFSSRAVDEISKAEGEIRNTYEERIDCNAEALALMLSLDGCFILEILRTLGKENFPVAEASNYYEPVFERNKIDYTGFDILCDILMLENQIPLIVLRKLLELELKSTDNVDSTLFTVLVKSPRSKFYPFKYDMKEWSRPQKQQAQAQAQAGQQQQAQQVADVQIHHLLGLLHNFIVSPPFPGDGDPAHQTSSGGSNGVRRIPCAVELRNAGIRFERCLGGIKNIRFEKKSATVFLPPIQITDYTEVLFRNLIAFELCKASEINYVTCYLSLMDELIDSEEDVGVLRKSGVVINYLGSDSEVAQLFNGLCSAVTVSRRDAFEELKGQVDEHYKSKFKVWSAEFVKEHVSSPWRCLALAAAILALLLTALQTVYSIIGVYK